MPWHHGALMSATTDAVPHSIAVDQELRRLLADPLRAQIVQMLAREQLCTCHLVELTGAKQTNISNHLRLLREAGLAVAEPHGRFTYYQLQPDALETLGYALLGLAADAREATGRRRACS